MTEYLFTTLVAKYFKSNVETYCSEWKIPFKILLLIDKAFKNLMQKYNEIHVVLKAANSKSSLQHMGQEAILMLK